MKLTSMIKNRAWGLIKNHKLNAKTLRQAKKRVKRMKVRNTQEDFIQAMSDAGVDTLEVLYRVENGEVSVYVWPDIKIDKEKLLQESENLRDMGFIFIELEMNKKFYRITEAEFKEEKVLEHLKDKDNIKRGLYSALEGRKK